MLNRLRFTPAWQGAVERREQAGFDVADGAVSEADGAGGGQSAQTLAKGKSRRWRDGGKRTRVAVARLYRATAWFRMRCGSDGAGLAGFIASAVTERVGGNDNGHSLVAAGLLGVELSGRLCRQGCPRSTDGSRRMRGNHSRQWRVVHCDPKVSLALQFWACYFPENKLISLKKTI